MNTKEFKYVSPLTPSGNEYHPVGSDLAEPISAETFDKFIKSLHEQDSSIQIGIAAKILAIVRRIHNERLLESRSQYEKSCDVVRQREEELSALCNMIAEQNGNL